MRYKGKIKELNHIIITDPSYDESVTCRYEKNNLKEKDWYVDIDIKPTIEKIENFTIKGTEFFLFLTKDRRLSELREDGTIRYLNGIKLEETEIGMDTACVALGINEKADEIIELRDEWQPECSLNTLTDGIFGTVKEGTVKGNYPVFIWISGYLDEDTGYSIEEIIDYLQYQFNITELEKDITKPMILKQQDLLDKMTEIELRFKEITKEDPKLLHFFSKDNRFSNIVFAGTYLARIAVRNEQRKAGNLDGKMEYSPYSKEQEKLIEEYTNLRVEFEKKEQEIDNDINI